MLRKTLLWIGMAALALIALFLANVGVHRWRGPTDAQEAAIATLEAIQAEPARGANAFAMFLMMRSDVADAEIDALAAVEVRKARDVLAAGEDLDPLIPAQQLSLPEPKTDAPGLCQSRDEACLARVRSNVQAARTLTQQYPRLLQRARMLEAKDSLRYEFPVTVNSPIPNVGVVPRLRRTELALAWIDGARAEAIGGTCRNVAAWRRLRHSTNSLIFSMLAAAYVNDATALFGEMLAELPSTEPLPDECASAFAAIEFADVSMCTELATELQFSRDAIRRSESVKRESIWQRLEYDVLGPVLFDARQTDAWRAGEFATFCGDKANRDALADAAVVPLQVSPGFFECAANAVGCMLHHIGAPAYEPYQRRLLDVAAHLRLAATLIWLRETRDAGRPLADRFATRPEYLRSGDRATGIADDERSIWVGNHYTERGTRYTLPLAPESARPIPR